MPKDFSSNNVVFWHHTCLFISQKELRQEAKRKIKKPRTSFGGVGQSVLDDDRDAGENVDTSDHLHDDADRYNQKKQKVVCGLLH